MSAERDSTYDRALKSQKELHTRVRHNPLFHPAEAESTLAPAGNIKAEFTPPHIALTQIQHTVALEHAPSSAEIFPFSFDKPSDCPYNTEHLVYSKVEKSLEKPAFLSTTAKGRRQA